METAFVYYVLDEPIRDETVVDGLFERVQADDRFVSAAGDIGDHRERFETDATAKFSYLAKGGGLELGIHDGSGAHHRVPDPLSGYPLFFVHDDVSNYEHSGEFAGSEAEEKTEALVDDAVGWYEWLVDRGVPVKYVFGDGGNRRQTIRDGGLRFEQRHVDTDTVAEIFWLQVFPPAMVETLGVDRVTSAPAHRVEELADGGYLLLQRPNPWFDSPANEEHGFDGLLVHLRTGD